MNRRWRRDTRFAAELLLVQNHLTHPTRQEMIAYIEEAAAQVFARGRQLTPNERGRSVRFFAGLLALVIVLAACGMPEPAPLHHEEYAQLCEAKVALIIATCDHEVACGTIEPGDRDLCVAVYATYFGWSGCGFVPKYGDEDYDACFAAVRAGTCSEGAPMPATCDGLFEAGDLAEPGT